MDGDVLGAEQPDREDGMKGPIVPMPTYSDEDKVPCTLSGCEGWHYPGIWRAVHLRHHHPAEYKDEFHAKNWGRKSKAAKRKAAEDAEAKSKRAKEQESAGPENVPADGERPTPVAALQDVAAATKQAKQMMDEDLIDQEVVDIMTHPAFTTPGANGEMYGASDLSECYRKSVGRWKCPVPFCTKAYRQQQHLDNHLTDGRCVPKNEVVQKIKAAKDTIEQKEGLQDQSWPNPPFFRGGLDFPCYRWPQDDPTAHWWIPQTAVRRFIDSNRVDRTHPEITRRHASRSERELLVFCGALAKTSRYSDLMVMQADEVLVIMEEFYPDRFSDYLLCTGQANARHLSDRKAAMLLSQRLEAVKQAAEFNTGLSAERKEERLLYYDPITQVVQYPAFSQLRPGCSHAPKPLRNRYPVPVLPGQFQQGFRRWQSSEEMKRYMNPPAMPAAPVRAEGTAMQKLLPEQEPNLILQKDMQAEKEAMRTQISERIKERLKGKPVVMQAVPQGCLCGICLKGAESNKLGVSEELITCSQCDSFGHPSCLEMSDELVAVIKTYKWQCMECKVCTLCEDPDDEANLLFCDECDRGYHTYCVGLNSLPRGRWICDTCGVCSSCNATQPGPEGANWQHMYDRHIRDQSSEEPRKFLCTLCDACARQFRVGRFCPVCLRVYRDSEDDLPMICCDECDRWVHTECEGISEERYDEISEANEVYHCQLCRGITKERYPAFHKRNRAK